MSFTINGDLILNMALTMPRVGAWHAEVESDGGEALAGSVSIDAEGEVFEGTIVRSGAYGGRVRSKVVGGGGGLSRTLEPKGYASGPKVSAVVSDILGSNEQLSPTSDQGVLDGQLGKWQRVRSQASHALVTLADNVGATWRVLSDGTVWVGNETWPEANHDHVLIDEDWYTGAIIVATDAPVFRPGVVFNGHQIEQVVHTLNGGRLRSELHTTSTTSALTKFLGMIRRELDYTKRYPARVAAVNADKTVQVVPDDARIKGSGLDKVRIRSGVPGTITAKKGARCMLGFDNGDPSAPYAADWDGVDVEELSLAGGTLPTARQGDMVLSGGPTTLFQFIGAGAPPNNAMVVGVPYQVQFISTSGGLPSFQLAGVVSSGRVEVKS